MYKTVHNVNMACIRQSDMACIGQSSDVKPANVFLTPSKDSAVCLPRLLSSECGMYKTVKNCIRQSRLLYKTVKAYVRQSRYI